MQHQHNVNKTSGTGLGLKATHGAKTSHAACIETRSTEQFDVVTTTRPTLSISPTTHIDTRSSIGITVLILDRIACVGELA